MITLTCVGAAAAAKKGGARASWLVSNYLLRFRVNYHTFMTKLRGASHPGGGLRPKSVHTTSYWEDAPNIAVTCTFCSGLSPRLGLPPAHFQPRTPLHMFGPNGTLFVI